MTLGVYKGLGYQTQSSYSREVNPSHHVHVELAQTQRTQTYGLRGGMDLSLYKY